MNIDDLIKKYEGTGITSGTAMMLLEDAKRESHFSKMLDPIQKLDWQEYQMDKLKELLKDTPTP